MSLYVFHPLTLIPILARWNSNSKESQTLGLLAVDENLLFLEYLCNCQATVGLSKCKMTKTEWVDSWQQPRCYSQLHWKWHLPTTLWCLGPRSPIKAHNQLVAWACCWVAWTTDLLKFVGKIIRKDVLSTGPRSNPLFDRTKGLHRFQNFSFRY